MTERVQFLQVTEEAFASGVEVPGRILGVVTRARHSIQRTEYKGPRPRDFFEEVPESYWIAYVEETFEIEAVVP